MSSTSSSSKFKKEIEKAPKVAAGELLKDYDYMGYLMKQGGSFKSWKKRLCILHTGRLYYYKKKTDILPKGMINVTGLTCDHVLDDKLVSGRPYGLKIISPHRTYYVCADSQEDADLWLNAINESATLNAEYMVRVVDCDKESDVKFHTIEEAVNEANEDDVIMVRNGTYLMKETLCITKPIHLRGVFDQDGGRCLVKIGLAADAKVNNRVDASSTTDPSASGLTVIHVQNTFRKSFRLSHLTVCSQSVESSDSSSNNSSANSSSSSNASNNKPKKSQKKNPGMINGSLETDGSSDKYNPQCCIRVSNNCQCLIQDVEITECLGQGVITENESMLTVQSSLIHGNTQNGIVARGESIVAIKSSRVESNGHYGILLLDRSSSSVSESQFAHNLSHAVRHESSEPTSITNSKFLMRGTTSPKQREPHVSVKEGSDAMLSGNSME